MCCKRESDGAGWVGKLLFSWQGKKFDYDLKQLHFASDLLMELGVGVELATVVVPHLFLPLACAANVAKNIGAVTSTSTRTPIYKAFTKGENIGDVIAKGECVGNVANLVINPFTKFALLMNPLARSIEELLPVRISCTFWCFILLRTALVISSVIVAFLVPFFIIVPALCFQRIVKKATTTQIVLSITTVALGIICAVLGTYSSLSEIAKQY